MNTSNIINLLERLLVFEIEKLVTRTAPVPAQPPTQPGISNPALAGLPFPSPTSPTGHPSFTLPESNAFGAVGSKLNVAEQSGTLGSAAARDGIMLGTMHFGQRHTGIDANFGYTNMVNMGSWVDQEPNGPINGFNPNFQGGLAQAQQAKAQGLQVKGPSVVWADPRFLPGWLARYNGNPSGLLNALNNHVTNMVKTMGQAGINDVDVINEPMDPNQPDGLRSNVFTQNGLGNNYAYIVDALKAAHAANPNARLIINDYGLEQGGKKWDDFLKMVKDLKAQGLPIEVGFEGKLTGMTSFNGAQFKSELEELKNIGVSANISELEVDSPQVAHDFIAAAVQSGNIRAITFTNTTPGSGQARPTGMWNADGTPDSIYYAVQAALQGQ